jgi:DNA-binding GntR family transcriptional regulator
MRGVLLRHGLASLSWPLRPQAIDALAAHQQDHADAVAERDLRRIYAHNTAFHSALHGLFHNRRLAETLDHLGWLLMVIRAYRALRLDSMTNAVAQHADMVAAARAQDRAAFTAAVLHHVRTPEDIYGEIQLWAGNSAGADR